MRALLLVVAVHAAAGCLIRGGSAPKAKIGDRFTICLEVNDQNRTVFNPEVDKLSALTLTGSYELEALQNSLIRVTASSPSYNASSVRKVYRGSGFAVPVYTAILSLNGGEVEGITWDDGCFFCDSSGTDCVQTSYQSDWSLITTGDFAGENCKVVDAECAASPVDCGLKVYIAWTGTDSNNEYLTSAGFRFSRFKQYDTGKLYDSAKSTV